MVPDNSLATSEDEGDTWRLMWKTTNPQLGSVQYQGLNGSSGEVPKLTATWSPGTKSPLIIETKFIAPARRWPDWHIRMHSTRRREGVKCESYEFRTVEGGLPLLATPCRCEDGTALPLVNAVDFAKTQEKISDGVLGDGGSSLICSLAGASGIVQLSPGFWKGEALKPDSNTNLMFQQSIILTVKQQHLFREIEDEVRFMVAVFAISRKHTSLSGQGLRKLWNNRPVIKFGISN